jgi:hypothetical protein
MSNTHDAVDHDPIESILAARGFPPPEPRPDDYVDTWADDYVDPWNSGRTATTQRSRNFDAWIYSVTREYKATQTARNALQRMTNDYHDLSDYFPKPGIARGRARYQQTHVHETMNRERLVQEIQRLVDEQNRLDEYDANPAPPSQFRRPRVERIKAQLFVLRKQLFAADDMEPPRFDKFSDVCCAYWLPSSGTEKTPRPLAPIVELSTRSLDRAPGAPNNG